jgi:hypothetical protein
MNQYFNYEIYTCDPITGTTGWEIQNISVRAETRKEARELIKNYPNFDVIILYNFEHKEAETAKFLIADHYPDYKIIDRIY